MGYRIKYCTNLEKDRVHVRLPVLITVALFLFGLLVKIKWPKGYAVIESVLFDSDSALAVFKLNEFAADLSHGNGLIQTLAEFWRNLTA